MSDSLFPASNHHERILYWWFFGMGLLWTTYLMVNSSGVFLHDEIGHFLISKNAWNYPELMLDIWGRPLNTVLYMVPSLWGLTAARVLSLLMAVLTVWFTTRVAAISGVGRLYLIPLLLWFQPWFNCFSYQAITEVPFSLCLILGVFLLLSGRETSAVIVFGLLPLIRHEGIALTAVYALYMFFQRKWLRGMLSAVPLAGYNIVYFAALNDWPFTVFLDAKPTEHYGHGSWLHFVPRLAYRAGIPVVLLALLGATAAWKHRRRCLYLVGYLAYFLVHTVIYRFGLFASAGYSIFLLPLAPAIAVMAALGGEMILHGLEPYRMTRTGLVRYLPQVVMLVVALCVLVVGFTSRPFPVDEEGMAMQEAAQWIREHFPSENLTIIASHAWFIYYYDLPWSPSTRWGMPVNLEQLREGSLLLWDRHYSELLGIHLEYLSNPRHGWRKLTTFRNGVAILFRKE